MAQVRVPDVEPLSGRLGAWADGLAARHSAAAEDSAAGSKKREAAALVSVAEGHAYKEEGEQALKAAQEALTIFNAEGDKAGATDATRLAVHVLCCTGKVSEGEAMAKNDLFKFRDAADKGNEAKMLLSMAEAHQAAGSPEALEQALQEAGEALRLFRGQADKTMIGASQLLLASIQLVKRGDVKRRADEAKQACDEALPIFRDMGDAKVEAYANHVMACTRALTGATEGALRAAKEAQGIYMKAELPKQAAFELHRIATWQLAEGEIDDAVAAAQEALDIFEDDLKGTDAEASVVQTLTQALLMRNDAKAALKLAKYQLDRFQESGNPKGEAAAQECCMLAYFAMGNTDRAMRFAQKAADTLEDMGDRKSQAKILRTICFIHRAKGDSEKALLSAKQSLSIFEDLEDTKEQAVTIQARADVYMERKEHGRALALAGEARELFSDAKHVEGEVSALLQLSQAQFAEGDHRKAAASAREAQDKSAEVQDQQGEAEALRTLLDVHIMDKEFDGALRVLGSLLTLVKEMGNREDEVTTMIWTCRAVIMQIIQKEEEGKSNEKMFKAATDKASKMAKDALAMARKLEGVPQVLGTALFTVAQTQHMNNKTPEATKSAEEALAVFRGCGFMQGEAAALTLLANIQLAMQDPVKARELGEEAIYLFQQIGDADGEDQAWTQLENVDKFEAEIRERRAREEQMQQQWQMQQWAQSQGMMPMQEQPMPGGEEEAPSAAAGGGYEAKLMKLDLGAGLDPVVLKGQILEVTKGLIGYDEDIDYDNPLMESGLTSNTAVLLRDALTQQLPGVNLPVTLVFDYPSISAMSELIVENAEKAARKAKKALKG